MGAVAKAQKEYDKAVKKYGLPAQTEDIPPEGPPSVLEQPGASPDAAPPVDSRTLPPAYTAPTDRQLPAPEGFNQLPPVEQPNYPQLPAAPTGDPGFRARVKAKIKEAKAQGKNKQPIAASAGPELGLTKRTGLVTPVPEGGVAQPRPELRITKSQGLTTPEPGARITPAPEGPNIGSPYERPSPPSERARQESGLSSDAPFIPPKTSPLRTPPVPKSSSGTSAYVHTPESLDTEITRAIMQNQLGETEEVVRETMRDIMANPEYAAYAQENYARLVQAAKQELAKEIELRFAKAEAEEIKLLESGNGKDNAGANQGTNAGDSERPPAGGSERGPESVAEPAAATENQTPTTEGSSQGAGISQLNAFPQNVIDFIQKADVIEGRVGLTDAQKRLAGIRAYKTQDYGQQKSFFQRIQEWGKRVKDTAKSNWTNRFDEIQKLGEDPAYAVDRYFGLSSEAGAYLGDLAAKVSDGIGNDPAMLKHLNEFLLLKRLEGRAMANPADPMVLKRFPSTQGNVGGYTEIQQRLQDMEQDLGPTILKEFSSAQGHVKQLVADIHQLWQDTGLFSAEDIANLTAADPDYIPLASMSHALEQLEAMTSSSGKKLGVNSSGGLVKKVGDFNQVMMSDDKPALDNLIDMVERSVKLVRKNEVVRTTVEALGPGAVPSASNTGLNLADWAPVSHHVDGKVVEHFIPRPVAEAVDRLTPQQAQGLGKFVQRLSGLQTQFLTGLNPVFAVVQIVKDIPTALIQNPDVAVGTLKNLPGAAKDTFTEAVTGRMTPRMQDFYRAGAGGSFVDDYRAGGDFKKFGEVIPKTMAQDLGRFKLLKTIERTNKAIDNAPRLAVYRAKLDQGATIAEAVHAARNATVDFAEGGALSKQVNQFIPFANVGIQGAKISLTALKKNYQEHPAALASVLAVTVGAPEMAAWFNNHRNSEIAAVYDDLPAYEKSSNVIFVLGNEKDEAGKYRQIIKYPMNDSMRAIRGAFIAGLQFAAAQHEDPDTGKTIKHDPSYLGQMAVEAIKIMPGGQFIPISADPGKPDSWGTGVTPSVDPIYQALPFLFRQSVELGVNKDTFRNKPILSDREIDIAKDPAQRENIVRPTTTSTARLLGKALNTTPVQTDYALDTTVFSGAGKTIKWIANIVTDSVTDLDAAKTKDNSIQKQFMDRFIGAYGGNADKRMQRDDAEGLSETALGQHQRSNAKKEIIEIMKKGLGPKEQALQILGVIEKVNKLNSQPLTDKQMNKMIEDATAEHATPQTPFMRELRRMGPGARYKAIKNHIKDMDRPHTELFLEALKIHGISEGEEVLEPQASLPSKQPQIAQVSPGKYQVTTRSGKVKTVTKNADGSLVIV
jgi:hypothetical protein